MAQLMHTHRAGAEELVNQAPTCKHTALYLSLVTAPLLQSPHWSCNDLSCIGSIPPCSLVPSLGNLATSLKRKCTMCSFYT